MEIPSDISWAQFRLTIANRMEIAEALLDVAWKLSTDAKSDTPRRLNAPAHLLQLLETATKHISGEIKTRSTKPFAVILKDMRPPPSKVVSKGKSVSQPCLCTQ